jgi:hypothetical protein
MDYKKTVEEILMFVRLNIHKVDYHNQSTYDYSQGYQKCLRSIVDIIERNFKNIKEE